MGATLSPQQDSKCEEDEEQHPGQEEALEDSEEDKLFQNSGQFSSQTECGKTESLTDEMHSQSDGQDLLDVGSGFVTLKEDPSDTTNGSQEDVSQTSISNISKQMNNTDDMVAGEENEANDKQNDSEIGFKKMFRFGGFKFTLKKDKVEKIDANEPIKIEEDINAASPSEDSWDTIDVNAISTNEQDAEVVMNETMRGDAHTESSMSAHTEHQEEASPDKEPMEDVPKSPEPEEPMSPLKQFFSQGLWSSLKKKKKEEEKPKENGEELKSLDKIVEKETAKDDTTCTCLDVSSSTFDQDKDMQFYKKDEWKPTAEADIINSVGQDKVQASPFKRIFRKLSTRRQSDTKSVDTNLTDPGYNSSENPQLSTELVQSQKQQETMVVVTQPSGEMMDMSHEESKKRSDSTVSWESLICVRSGKTRARKISDTEDETQDKGEVLKRTSESPVESSTDADHLTSSNEQGESPAEDDSGSTWKTFKKFVTPKRKSSKEESGLVEQMQSDPEITKDESSCSLRKLISGRKRNKPDSQQETISSDEGSKETGTDFEDDETPGVVPLSEYESVEPESLNLISDGKIESTKDKEMQPLKEEDKPKQIQPLHNDKPLSFDAGAYIVPISTEHMEELTDFISKHQQLSDIPEEGMIEESVATPLSFVEWTTQDDTIDDDVVDMTADAVTAPEPASEPNEDESTEMVSAVSQLSESPKTTGNVTPVSPVYDMRESDMILQEVVESISMVPSLVSFTTKDKVPEALEVSVSQFIVESTTTTTETKVLVTHKKEEATSICIGIVSQEIRAAEVVLPLHIAEGISEFTHSIPTEIVSVDLAEESEAAGRATDNVHKDEIKEIRTMLHEAVSHAADSTVLTETERKSKQTFIMIENVQEEVSPVIQMEDVDDESTEFSNGIPGFTLVQSAVQGGSQFLMDQITGLNIIRPETEGPLQSALEEPVYEYLTENTETHVEAEKEHRIPDVKSSTADGASNIIELSEVLVSDVKCVETTMSVRNVIPISSKIETELKNEVQMKNDPLLQNPDTGLTTTLDSADTFELVKKTEDEEKLVIKHTPAETTEDIVDEKITPDLKAEILLEIIDEPTNEREGKEHELNTFVMERTLQLTIINEENAVKEAEDKSKEQGETVQGEKFKREQTTGDEIYMLTFKSAKTEEEIKKAPVISEQPTVYEEVAEDGIQQPTTDSLEPVSHPTLSKLIACAQTTALNPGSVKEYSAKSEAVKTTCVDDETDKRLENESEQTETAKPDITFEIPTKRENLEVVKPFYKFKPQLDRHEPQTENLEPIHETYEETNQTAEAADTVVETTSAIKHDEEAGVDYNMSDQTTPLLHCLKHIDSGNLLAEVEKTDTLSAEKQNDNATAEPNITKGIITELQGTKFLNVNTEQPQKQALSLKPEEIQATESGQEPYKENQVTSNDEITANISSVIYEEGVEMECKESGQPVETGQYFKNVNAVLVNTMENVTEIDPEDKSKTQSQDGFVQSETKESEHAMEVVKTTYPISTGVVSEHEVELIVGSEQTIVSQDVAEQEVVTETGEANVVVGKNTELLAASNLKDEATMTISEGPVVPSETEAESPLVTENEPEPEMLKQVELKSEILEIVVSETCVVDSLVSEPEVETQVTVTAEMYTRALTSEIINFQSDFNSLNTPDVSTATTLRESPIVSEIQTETSLASLTAAPSPVLMKVAEKRVTHINRPVIVEVTEPNLEMLMVTEAISHISEVPALEEQKIKTSAINTEISVRTCVEKNVNAQSLVVTSIKETELETPDTVNALKIAVAKETRVGTPAVTGQIIKAAVLTSVVQTPTMFATEVQRLTVVPVVKTQAVNSAVNEVDMAVPRIEVKERYCDAQVEVRQPPHTEAEVKVAEITNQVTRDIENKDFKSPEEMTGKLHKVSVPTVETAESLAGPDEDVWEDAVDDISDDQSIKTSGGLQDITMYSTMATREATTSED